MKKTEPDFYEVLGVQRNASLGAIKQAYRELVRKYHPDAAGEDLKAREQFDLLQAAYETLSDPAKRAQYDKTLPTRKYPLSDMDAESLWREATDLTLERADSFGPMIQAMRVGVGITFEGDLLIVGVAGKDQYLAGHLETPANRYRIVAALREIAGRDIEYRVIEGTALEDWEWVKRAEGRRTHLEPPPPLPELTAPAPKAARAPAAAGRRTEAPMVTEWELLSRKIQNTWQGQPNRQHPLTRAEFLFTCVNWISDAAKAATNEGGQRDTIHREVGKAVEKVAQLLEISPTVVALELLRTQPRRRAG